MWALNAFYRFGGVWRSSINHLGLGVCWGFWISATQKVHSDEESRRNLKFFVVFGFRELQIIQPSCFQNSKNPEVGIGEHKKNKANKKGYNTATKNLKFQKIKNYFTIINSTCQMNHFRKFKKVKKSTNHMSYSKSLE